MHFNNSKHAKRGISMKIPNLHNLPVLGDVDGVDTDVGGDAAAQWMSIAQDYK